MARYEIACLKNKLLVLSLRGEGKYFSFWRLESTALMESNVLKI